VAGASDVGPATRELAELLIENARADEYPVDEEATLWGLAALRRASQLTDGEIKLKTLSQYTDEDSDAISSRARQLRSVLSQIELNNFRIKYDQRTSEPDQECETAYTTTGESRCALTVSSGSKRLVKPDISGREPARKTTHGCPYVHKSGPSTHPTRRRNAPKQHVMS